MWPFKKRKPESPEEKQALANLDEVTREVAGAEMEKGALRRAPYGGYGRGGLGPVGLDQAVETLVHGDPDPPGGPSMHDVMHGADVDEDDPKP
jgi:hypothetical protein